MKTKILLTICFVALVNFSFAQLLISEYIEGSSYNKAIEVLNNGATAVDQTQITIEGYFNGGTTPQTVTLSAGTLNPGDIWVIVNSNSAVNQSLKDKADQFNGSAMNFNGNDAVVLKLNGVIQDSIGQVGFDPGTEWNVNGVSTLNHTLVRKNTTADTTTSDAYDPSVNFTQEPVDNFTFIGSPSLVPVELSEFLSE